MAKQELNNPGASGNPSETQVPNLSGIEILPADNPDAARMLKFFKTGNKYQWRNHILHDELERSEQMAVAWVTGLPHVFLFGPQTAIEKTKIKNIERRNHGAYYQIKIEYNSNLNSAITIDAEIFPGYGIYGTVGETDNASGSFSPGNILTVSEADYQKVDVDIRAYLRRFVNKGSYIFVNCLIPQYGAMKFVERKKRSVNKTNL